MRTPEGGRKGRKLPTLRQSLRFRAAALLRASIHCFTLRHQLRKQTCLFISTSSAVARNSCSISRATTANPC
ncbi:hypothetical protein VARIO8X_120119 [Burkholderiales bacterium 8X]|nr:hypothetical protein VARIO8X_120119 [Burkholderiales bacterium 8X]